jgi:hypothetical protein
LRARPALDAATFVRRISAKVGTLYGAQLTRDAFAIVERSGDPEPWTREVQRARDAGLLAPGVAWFLIYKFVESAMFECVATDPELVALGERIEAIERAEGLGDDEYFHVNEGPPEWKEATRAWEVVYDARFAEIFRRVGEHALAVQRSDGGDDPLFTEGREAIFGCEEAGERAEE